ncbi:MAG: F0F1 ATP synthase subunit gamma [Candidatus Ancillula sp.]|jgi:F-type H+-transporting ATPase subunit gamma|nr:F0F1 ATP synthase subunit gamma [Candidatus Ancillula sp.]
MVSQLEYKKRTASTKNLQKIFGAQELIAASRIAKARDLAVASAPYSAAITEAISQVATYTSIKHPLTATRDELGKKLTNRIAILCVTSDRGMAGSYSASIIRTTETLCDRIVEHGKTPVLFTSGRRAHSYYQYRGRSLEGSWEGDSDAPNFERAKEIAKKLVDTFLSDNLEEAVDELLIVSTEFVNMVTQRPKIVRMLPMSITDGDLDGVDDITGDSAAKTHLFKHTDDEFDEQIKGVEQAIPPLYHFEPEEEEVLDALLPTYISSRIHACLLEAAASETASRQRAMHTATDNAKDLVEDLIRKSNQARQAGITQELTEIVSSADALNAG